MELRRPKGIAGQKLARSRSSERRDDGGNSRQNNTNKGRAAALTVPRGIVWMRQLLVPTCLFITAWAQPANPIYRIHRFRRGGQCHRRAKDRGSCSRRLTHLPSFSSSAAETTSDALARGQVEHSRYRVEPPSRLQASSSFDEAGFADGQSSTLRPSADAAAPACSASAGLRNARDAAVDHNIPDAIPHSPDLAGKPLQPERRQPGRRTRRRAVHAGDRGRDAARRSVQSARGGARLGGLLRELIQQFGNLGLAAAAYNAGPQAACRIGSPSAASLPKETRDYVQHITGVARRALEEPSRPRRPIRVARARRRASAKPAFWPPTGPRKFRCRRSR